MTATSDAVAGLSAGDKTQVLVEALPYIRAFRGTTVVLSLIHI